MLPWERCTKSPGHSRGQGGKVMHWRLDRDMDCLIQVGKSV